MRNVGVSHSSGVRGECKTAPFCSLPAFPALEPRLPWKHVLSQAGESCWAALQPAWATLLSLHQQKSTFTPPSSMRWLGTYLGLLRDVVLKDLRTYFGSQKIPDMASKKAHFFNNCIHLLIFYYITAVFHPEELFKLPRCHVKYMSVSIVQTDYEGSKNHTQPSSGVNWHHPIEFADCSVYSQDAQSCQNGRYITSSANFIHPFISL